jgi:predicted nucleotidyltransferase
MAKIKTIIVLVFLGLGLHQSYSQTYKFKTSGLSVMGKDQKGNWGKWSDLDLVNILVKLDTDKNRITVYSEAIQVFEIVEYIPLEESEADSVYSFTCKDNNGENCTLSIITRKKQDNRKQLYINYEDRIILYNIFNFK